MATYVPTRLSQTRKEEEKKVRNHGDYFLEKEEKRWETASCVRLPPFFPFSHFCCPNKRQDKKALSFSFSFFRRKESFPPRVVTIFPPFFGGKGGNWGPKIAGNWKEFTFLRYISDKAMLGFLPNVVGTVWQIK